MQSIISWNFHLALVESGLPFQSSSSGRIPNSSSVHWEGSGYAKWPSTASESCHKRQRIQNHMVPLKNSAWSTWDLVSWGNCRYWGSMCTPPPALRDRTTVSSRCGSTVWRYGIQNSELHPETNPNVSHLHHARNDSAPQSLKILICHKLTLNLCTSKN